MKSAAFREDYKVTFGHCIVLTLTLKNQFPCRTNQKFRELEQQKEMLFDQGVTESNI